MMAGSPSSPQIGRGFAQVFPSFGSWEAASAGSLGKTLPLEPFPLTGWGGSLLGDCGWPSAGPIPLGACNLSLRASRFGALGPI